MVKNLGTLFGFPVVETEERKPSSVEGYVLVGFEDYMFALVRTHMLDYLKNLLNEIDNKLLPWAQKVKTLIAVLKEIFNLIPSTAPQPPPLVLAASADVEEVAKAELKRVIAILEQPQQVHLSAIGDGSLFNILLPILMGLFRKWLGF